jgi:hypothetical protein
MCILLFVAENLDYRADRAASSSARFLLIGMANVKPLRFISEVAQCLSLMLEMCFSNRHIAAS